MKCAPNMVNNNNSIYTAFVTVLLGFDRNMGQTLPESNYAQSQLDESLYVGVMHISDQVPGTEIPQDLQLFPDDDPMNEAVVPDLDQLTRIVDEL